MGSRGGDTVTGTQTPEKISDGTSASLHHLARKHQFCKVTEGTWKRMYYLVTRPPGWMYLKLGGRPVCFMSVLQEVLRLALCQGL